jgi:hypothetical protein
MHRAVELDRVKIRTTQRVELMPDALSRCTATAQPDLLRFDVQCARCRSVPCDRRSTDPETGEASGLPEAAICVQDIDVQCVLQFTLVNAAGCALHRHTSRVIHRLEWYVSCYWHRAGGSARQSRIDGDPVLNRPQRLPSSLTVCASRLRDTDTVGGRA